jgi:hypothetical protein
VRTILLILFFLLPLPAAADVAVPPHVHPAQCLAAVRQALAADYPNDKGHDNDFCETFDVLRWGTCETHSCVDANCDCWSSSLVAELERSPGSKTTAWSQRRERESWLHGWSWKRSSGGTLAVVVVHYRHEEEEAEETRLRARAWHQAAIARRVLDECLAR